MGTLMCIVSAAMVMNGYVSAHVHVGDVGQIWVAFALPEPLTWSVAPRSQSTFLSQLSPVLSRRRPLSEGGGATSPRRAAYRPVPDTHGDSAPSESADHVRR